MLRFDCPCAGSSTLQLALLKVQTVTSRLKLQPRTHVSCTQFMAGGDLFSALGRDDPRFAWYRQ